MIGIEHHEKLDVTGFFDFDLDDLAGFEMVGDGRDRTLIGFVHGDGDVGLVRHQRAAPAPRAKRADGRQREQRCVDRKDGSMRRQVIGGRARGRRDEDAVANQFFHPYLAVDGDLKLGRLMPFAKERDFVDRELLVGLAIAVVGDHGERMDAGDIGGGKPFHEADFIVAVHQEADGPAVHAVDRGFVVDEAVQGLQHQAIAAERDNGVGAIGRHVAITLD